MIEKETHETRIKRDFGMGSKCMKQITVTQRNYNMIEARKANTSVPQSFHLADCA